MHARAGGHGRVGGWQEREGFSPLVVHRGGHGLLRAATSAFSTPCRWAEIPHHTAAIPHQRRMGGATRRNPVHDNGKSEKLLAGEGNTSTPVNGRSEPANVLYAVVGGLRAAAGGRAAPAAGQDARDTYGSASRAAFAYQLSVGTACRRADQQVRSSTAC